MQAAYGLRRRSRFSRTVALFCLGVLGTLLFGVAGAALAERRTAADLIVLYGVAAGCLVLAVATGARLWRRWRDRPTGAWRP